MIHPLILKGGVHVHSNTRKDVKAEEEARKIIRRRAKLIVAEFKWFSEISEDVYAGCFLRLHTFQFLAFCLRIARMIITTETASAKAMPINIRSGNKAGAVAFTVNEFVIIGVLHTLQRMSTKELHERAELKSLDLEMDRIHDNDKLIKPTGQMLKRQNELPGELNKQR